MTIMVSDVMLCPKHASIIWGLSNTLASTSGIIAPAVAGHHTMDRVRNFLMSHHSWLENFNCSHVSSVSRCCPATLLTAFCFIFYW